MKRRMMSLLAAAMMLTTAIVPASYAFAEEDLVLSVPGNEQVLDKTDEESVLDEMNSANESILGALGKKDWEALAKSVEKTGDWREDLVAIAQSQVGYTEESDGTTIYADWAGYENGANWTALFVNWVANKAGLTTKQFPSGDSYASLVNAMRKVNAVKTISRSNYPVSGDLALIKANGQELVAFVVYVSNGYASVIHGDDQGAVTRVTYRVSSSNFSTYIDLNELLERAGVEVGKGGKVPVIPAEGIAAWTNTNAVYMRSEASTASKRVTTLKRSNTAVLVTDAEMGEDGYIWYAVKYSRYTGYIRSDLLKLDQEALSAAQPTAVPTATPTAAPTAEPTAEPTAIPGCVLCAQEANGAELPVECCYAQLKSMTAQESYEFMSKLLEEDYVTFVLYVNCHNAHVYDGSSDAVICYTGCEQSIFTPVAPGAAHSADCGWYIEAATTATPEVTVVPTAAPTVVPAVTPAPTSEPTAEPTEAPTAEPTEAPTEAPVAPSACSLCAAESEYWGVALPANGCVYAYLSGMTANEAYEVLNDLDWNNYSGYRMYLDCHNDHVLAGEAAVICYGDVCGAGTWTQPGDAHEAACPWYAEAGLSVQERVVDVTVVQGGNSVQIKFSIAGATNYQWYQVGPKADGTDDIAVSGAMTDTLTVQTSSSSKSFYCVATMPGNFQVKSKLTVVDVATSPIVAEAIVGEVVKFTFSCTGAERYQWYDMGNMPLSGATSSELSLIADPAASNMTYYCIAWDANDNELGTSNYYSYTIKTVAELTDEDLCKYVDELALLSRSARLDLMALWGPDLTEKVRDHWKNAHNHAINYADLLCICGLDTTGGAHAYNCPWWDISSCGTTSWEADVLGWKVVLTAFEDKEEETRSTWTFQWWDAVSNQALQGETSTALEVTYTLAEQKFYCVAAAANGLQYRSDTFIIPAAQTTNFRDYVATLDTYYQWSEDDNEYYQTMHTVMTGVWNIAFDNGKNLAVEVLKYWSANQSEMDNWLLCSCCIDEAGNVSSQIVLPPHSKHSESCLWYVAEEEDDLTNATDHTTGVADNNVNIKVAAEAFAEDYVLNAEVVENNTVAGAVSAAVALADNKVLAAYDINFTAVNGGGELKPANAVTLTFTVPSTLENGKDKTLYVYHILDNGTAEVVGIFPVTANGQTIAIKASDFSVYAVSEADTTGVCATCAINIGGFPKDMNGNSIECAYTYLKNLETAQAQYAFMSWLVNDYIHSSSTRSSFIGAYDDHLSTTYGAGDSNIICSCKSYWSPVAPGPSHATGCPWKVAATDVVLDMKNATESVIDGHTVYVGAQLTVSDASGSKAIVATTVNLDNKYTYFQDENTDLNVAYLHIDADGRPWIIPLLSENAAN